MTKQKLKLNDFLKYRYPSALACSPDGGRYCFMVKRINESRNCYEYDLYCFSSKTGKSVRLTSDGVKRSFIWEDDSHILAYNAENDAALEKRGVEAKWTAVSRYDVTNGQHSAFMRIPANVSYMKKLGGSKYLVCAGTSVQTPDFLALSGDRLEKAIEKELHERGYKTFTELPFCENGSGMINGGRNSLFVFDAGDDSLSMITKPTWDVNHIDVKDGRVLFTAFPFTDIKKVEEGLYIYDLGTGETKTLIPDDRYSIDYAAFVKDGIICLALVMNDYGVYEHPTFFAVDENGGGEKALMRYDRRVSNAVCNDTFDGKTTSQRIIGDALYFINTDGIDGRLCSYAPGGEVETVIGGNISVMDFDGTGSEFAFVAFEGLKLPEIYLSRDGGYTQVTHFNDALGEDRALVKPERFRFKNSEGIEIDGFVLKPADFAPGKRYPGVLHVHGGPKMVFSSVFHHEMQLWAANGYFVCYCNPRGSCGKGNEFANIRFRLGTIDYDDLMEFTNECIARYPELDPERMAVVGGSYGGFMTNWVIGHTDRFRCAVSQRSIANYCTDYLLSDIGYYYVPDQHGATLWNNVEKLFRDSPVKYADKVRTPTLFIHSTEDYRCPLTNGLEMFAALKVHNVEAKLCVFNGENHSLSRSGKPSNRICRMEEILSWLNDHLKENGR